MTAAAFDPTRSPDLIDGTVRLREGSRISVSTEVGDLLAKQAASCLLRPEPDDRVLVALAPEPFVLAVLERRGGESALELPGDVSLRAGGRLELSGEDGISLKTPAVIRMVADRLAMLSQHAELATEELTTIAKRAQASFDEGGLVAKALDMVSERMTSRTAKAFRFVSELDQLRARHFDYRADHAARISGENTIVTAREVVKVDGEQVHIG